MIGDLRSELSNLRERVNQPAAALVPKPATQSLLDARVLMVNSRVVTIAWPALPQMTVAGRLYRVHYKLHNQSEEHYKLGLEAPAEACGRYEQDPSSSPLEYTFQKLHRSSPSSTVCEG